uniref:Uncharacterized protein n=1 Tax=Arundo donax TaxID=35708 RepID=A0A0A9CS62_ARUDO
MPPPPSALAPSSPPPPPPTMRPSAPTTALHTIPCIRYKSGTRVMEAKRGVSGGTRAMGLTAGERKGHGMVRAILYGALDLEPEPWPMISDGSHQMLQWGCRKEEHIGVKKNISDKKRANLDVIPQS